MKNDNLKFKNTKKVIIIMGAPGSGKGTQASLLSEKLKLYHLESSKVIEAKIAQARPGKSLVIGGKKYSLSEEKRKWQTGLLCTPAVVAFWMEEKIRELAAKRENLIFSGSPRTVFEAERLIPILANLYGKKNIKTVFLEISPQETIFRNSHRKICELMRHPILFSKETEKLLNCPLDGSKLVQRKGLDDPKTIQVRLERYKQETLPAIDFLKKSGFSVKRVNGSPPPAAVFNSILKALGEKG